VPTDQLPEKEINGGKKAKSPFDLGGLVQLQTSIFDQVSDAIIITDLEGNIIFWNKQTELLTQVLKDEALGKSIFDMVVPRIEAEKGLQIVEDFNNTGHWKGEITFQRRDGTIFTASITSTLLKDEGGEPIGIIGLGRDVTEKKRTEAALNEYSEELKRRNEELENFAYIASHDLREPLRMVTNYLLLLEKKYKGKALDDKAYEYIHFADDGANRLSRLIDDLLEYSRVKRVGRPSESVDMGKVLEQVLESLRVSLNGDVVGITHEKLPTITADSIQMYQLLQNLVSNAVKYRRGDSPRVHISAERKEAEWVFSIEDNGIGIPEDQQDRIFKMFQRLHTQDEYPGTGIGLAIAKKIVERHGGKIWVRSQVGCGSTFYFSIPTDETNLPV
jgi:PAS domain S-box-containing protein